MVQIIPNICETDKTEVERKVKLVAPYVEVIQIDIADQTLVPLVTTNDLSWLSNVKQSCLVEAHLMVSKPELFVTRLIRYGIKRIIGHVESQDPREFLAEARAHECEVGLAIDLETPLEDVEPFLEELDCVQVMTTHAGSSGQLFEEGSLGKIKAIHRNFPDLPIAAEGGMIPETVKLVADAGATRIVSTSYLFHDESRAEEAIKKLQEVAG